MPYLYSDSDYMPEFPETSAFMLIPEDHPLYWVNNHSAEMPQPIDHQYGCISCRHFMINGRAELIQDNYEQIADELSCNGKKRTDVLSRLIGAPVKTIHGEALVELEDGRYVATYNCD